MRIKKYIFLPLIAALGLILSNRAFRKPALAKPALQSTPYDPIDAYIKGQMQRLNIPGISLAVVEGDQIVYFRGFGRTRPNGEAPAPETPFFIGSLTKSFTALAVMQFARFRLRRRTP